MRVNPNSELSVVAAASGPSADIGPRLGQDKLALANSDTLTKALNETPEVRPDKVAQAKAMIQDVTYPPAVIIRKISALLAIKVDSQDQSA